MTTPRPIFMQNMGNTKSQAINDGVVEGKFPRRALRHVLEWYELHRDELIENWERCAQREALRPIAPLE